MDHFRLAVPSKKEVGAEFGQVASPIFDCIRGGMEVSRKLATVCDCFLLNLLSGRFRVCSARAELIEPVR